MPFPGSGGALNIPGALKIIRLAYHGCTNRPFFHIVVMEKQRRRQEWCIEQLGTYDPLPNSRGERLCALNVDRLLYWIGKDVLFTKGVQQLLGTSGLTCIHPRTIQNAWIKKKEDTENNEATQD